MSLFVMVMGCTAGQDSVPVGAGVRCGMAADGTQNDGCTASIQWLLP